MLRSGKSSSSSDNVGLDKTYFDNLGYIKINWMKWDFQNNFNDMGSLAFDFKHLLFEISPSASMMLKSDPAWSFDRPCLGQEWGEIEQLPSDKKILGPNSNHHHLHLASSS